MEYRKVCNVCGRIYCYDDSDIRNNKSNAAVAILGSISAIANAFDGTRYDMYESNKMADRASSKITDFSKCPHCGSRDIRDLTDEEYRDYKDGLVGDAGSKVSGGIQINTNASVDALIQRGMLFLEEGNWKTAQAYFDNALDADPANADAYIGKMMIDYRIKSLKELNDFDQIVDENSNFIKALRFSDGDKNKQIEEISQNIRNNIIFKEKNFKYHQAIESFEKGTAESLDEARDIFLTLTDFKDSNDKAIECLKLKYRIGANLIQQDSSVNISEGISILEDLGDFENVEELLENARIKLADVKTKEEKQEREESIRKEKTKKKNIIIGSFAGSVILALVLLYIMVLGPMTNYNKAMQYMESGDYLNAYKYFKKAPNYKDSGTYLNDLIVVPVNVSYKNNYSDYDRSGVYSFTYSNKGLMTGYNHKRQGIKSSDVGTVSYGLSYDSSGRITSRENGWNNGFEYNEDSIGVEFDEITRNEYWTFDYDGNVTEHVDSNSVSKEMNDYTFKTTRKNKKNLAEKRSKYQNGKFLATQTFHFSYNDMDLIDEVIFTRKNASGYGNDDKNTFNIEYDVKYIPDATVKSDDIFRNMWILVIGLDLNY